jgi:putative membrane protein
MMHLFLFLLALLVVIALAIFAVQNSTAPMITMKFLLWQFETSLVYTILGSIGSGMVLILLLWIPSAIKGTFRLRNLKKELDILKKEMKHQMEATRPKES